MTRTKYSSFLKFSSGIVFLPILSCYSNPVLAQITPDNTLGNESSQVNSSETDSQEIDGGAIRGANLFHSFREFNVGEGQTVNFSNPDGVTNIFNRVTGNNISQILGDLGVSGNANLFLLNPNGIVFGEQASLNLNGSFVGTTANSIVFNDGNQFVANPVSEQPLLTVNVPIGLQFGNEPGAIINQAQSPQKALLNDQFSSSGNPAGLSVMSNQTLALIGNEIVLEGGNITAEGGSIELGSVGQNSLVGLELTESGIVFDYQAVENFSDITLSNREGFILEVELDENGMPNFMFPESPVASFLNSNSVVQTGSINVQGRNIKVLNGSQISTSTLEDTDGGNITINAAETLTVKGRNLLRNQIPISAAIFSTTVEDGNAGNIKITSNKLVIADSANISSDANSIFDGVTDIPANGDGGNVDITTEELLIDNNGAIKVSTEGTGNAGNITIKTRSLTLNDLSEISAETVQSNGGNINLQIDNNLELRNQSNISASVGGDGDGGNISIDAEFVITSPQDNSDIIATAIDGMGGNISIDASGIFGLSQQTKNTDLSDINASSEFGTDGTITLLNSDIQTDTNNTNTEVILVENAPSFTPNSCYASKQNKYIQAGRGGLPLGSISTLVSEYTWEDWRMIDEANSATVTVNNSIDNQEVGNQNKTNQITPVQGWLVNQQGEIVLTANPIMVTPHPPETTSPGC